MTIRVRALSTALFAISIALVEIPAGAQSVTAVTSLSVRAKIGDFGVAVSNYFKVSENDVVAARDRRVSNEDLPVVMFIAQHASVAPSTVVDLRQRGYSWWDISVRYRLGAETYYVPVAGNPGPPFGRAYGFYKNKPRDQWNTIVLADADIINLVHLRFLTDYYRVSPQRVMEVRGRTGDVVAVQREIAGNGRGRG
jgi:hypothetical protein